EMMQKADTIGVFQIESRAQMATLPRMKPECFYDVVIEVAIIRPGPIQGDMVHPYLARRAGREPVTYFDPRLEPVLGRTLGVPLFQEQMLKIAMVMADFSGEEAEELRRALSFHRSEERMNKVSVKLRAAMARKNITADVINKIIQSITSFALYGFPEEHAEELVRQRQDQQFDSLDDFKRRVSLSKEELRTLAALGALNCFVAHRRAAMWRVEEQAPEALFAVAGIGDPGSSTSTL